jgi:hypothetical protein
MSYLRYLCSFAHSGVQHILCCVFFRLLVYTMLPVSLVCLYLIGHSFIEMRGLSSHRHFSMSNFDK